MQSEDGACEDAASDVIVPSISVCLHFRVFYGARLPYGMIRGRVLQEAARTSRTVVMKMNLLSQIDQHTCCQTGLSK